MKFAKKEKQKKKKTKIKITFQKIKNYFMDSIPWWLKIHQPPLDERCPAPNYNNILYKF